MIVGLTVSNFRSYRDKAEFSLLALEDDKGYNPGSVTTVELEDGSCVRLLNSAVIFGANASGKSNVLHAMEALSNTVSSSLRYTGKRKPHFIDPYAFSNSCLNRPTLIELEFILKGKRFVYRITGKMMSIQTESLVEIRNGRKLKVFSVDSKRKISTGAGWPLDKELVDDSNLLPNQLFLSWLATKDYDGLQDIASYIADLTVCLNTEQYLADFNRSFLMESVIGGTDSKVFKILNGLMHIVDLGVNEINARRNEDKDFKIPDSVDKNLKELFITQNRWDIKLVHDTDEVKGNKTLQFSNESEGSKAIFSVGARLINALENGDFIIYDEISNAIHPDVLRLLLLLFHSKKTNPHGAQLVFSTHDASVAADDLLRSDQVWFAEKHKSASELYSAQDFEDCDIRVPFESWYRLGRFGARPNLGDIEKLFEL